MKQQLIEFYSLFLIKYQAIVVTKQDLAIARIELYGTWLKMLRIEIWLKSVIRGNIEEAPYPQVGQFKSQTIVNFHLDAQQYILATVVETRKSLEAKLHSSYDKTR